MQALVLAGGKGLRLRPLTENVPKCLVDVGGKPILMHIFSWLAKHGIDEVVLAVGYKHEAVTDFLRLHGNDIPMRVALSVEDIPLGTGGGIKNAARNGDVITDADLSSMIRVFYEKKEQGVKAVMALRKERSPYGVALVDGNLIIHSFEEKPELQDVWINAGIYVMASDVVSMLPDSGDVEKCLFPKLAWEHKLAGVKISGYWRSVDSLKDIEEVNGELKRAEN